MNNLLDYIRWRGDLPLQTDGLNEIDAVILARLSYIPFDGIVPEGFEQSVTAEKAAMQYLEGENAETKILWPDDLQLLQEVIRSERFRQMRLCGYVNQVKEDIQLQFCALTVALEPGRYYVSYRGTDNTLVGWKEDFNMGYLSTVPSQTAALNYLNHAMEALPGEFLLGGHSKGGNLAVYSAAFCSEEKQNRITAAYNIDGPGFKNSILGEESHRRIAEKIYTFVPQSSIVGMLLEHEAEYSIVRSSQTGIMQHDVYSWEVMGTRFVCAEAMSDSSRILDQTFREWMSGLTDEDRGRFIEAVYSILASTNADTTDELTENWMGNSKVMLDFLRGMDEDTRKMVLRTLAALFRSAGKNFFGSIPKPAFGQVRKATGEMVEKEQIFEEKTGGE